MNFINDLDNKIYELLTKTQNPKITETMIIISFFASAITLIGLSIVLILILKKKKYSRFIALNLTLSFITNRILKFIIRRPRPPRIQIVHENGYSFPSSHAMVSFAFYGFIIYLLCTNVKNKVLKYSITIVLSIIVILIGISRIYLGVHYVTDIIGGFIFGCVYLIIFIKKVYKNGKIKMKQD